MKRTLTCSSVFMNVALVASSLLLAARAEAGIIIMNNGKVFIGRIDADDIKEDKVTMHSPQQYRGAPPIRGVMDFQRHDIRWVDAANDEPTDEYMKLHAKEPLDPKWYALYVQPWLDAQDNQVQYQPLVNLPQLKSGGLSVMSIPRKWGSDEASIRRPTGWTTNEVNGITVFVSDQKGTDGFVPRIHFFSIESAVGQYSDQLSWVKNELEKLASTSDSFEIKGENTAPKTVRGGCDVEWTTTTRRSGRSIKALRVMRFRDHRAYFVTCYAHEKDFDQYQLIFEACTGSLAINEGAGSAASAGGDAIDVSGVSVGQTYRWKSANVPDQVVWEVTVKDVGAVRHKTTMTGSDGTKQTREDPETIAPVDPVARMTDVCKSPASPQKVGTETLTVSGASFDCDIYEAAANGKKYKAWLSKKFPVVLKVTVDGGVERELAEIK
jgi:hypothetical protein